MVARSLYIVSLVALTLFVTRNAIAQVDYLPNVKVGLNLGAYVAGEEFTRSVEDYTLRPALSVFLEYPFAANYGLKGSIVGGTISKQVHGIQELDRTYEYDNLTYKTTAVGTIIGPYYRIPIIPNSVSIQASANLGLFGRVTDGLRDGVFYEEPLKFIVSWGVGAQIRYHVTDWMSAQVGYNGFLTNSDELDGFNSGNDRDGFSHFEFGLAWNIYSGRVDDLPYDPFAMDTDEILERAAATMEVSQEGKAEWYAGEESENVLTTEAALTSTILELSKFESLSDLRDDDTRLMLTLEKNGLANLPLEINFELRKNDEIIAQGARDVDIMQAKSVLTAKDFIDFRGLNVMRGYDDILPDGKYELRVVVVDRRNQNRSLNTIAFQRVNMERLFGSNAPLVEKLINSNQAQVLPSETNEIIIKLTSSNNSIAGLGSNDLDELVAANVHETFDMALGIRNNIINHDTTDQKPLILLADIYFDEEDNTYIRESDRRLISSIARRMRNHPQLRMEIRGYADEFRDDVRNELLAEKRAIRVMDWLTRELVPSFRMYANGSSVEGADGSERGISLQENRKVSVLMTYN